MSMVLLISKNQAEQLTFGVGVCITFAMFNGKSPVNT